MALLSRSRVPSHTGDLELTITWVDGTETLAYTVRALVAFVGIDPTVEAELTVDGSIIVTFDNPPEDVTVNEGVASTAWHYCHDHGVPSHPVPLR